MTQGPTTGPTTGPRLVLHLGMHKTGTTALQALMAENRAALRSEGVLFPKTGYAATELSAVRAGGNPGHLGLLQAHRRRDDAVWQALMREVDRSDCDTVVISCENMTLPMDPDREVLIAGLAARFAGFRSVEVIAFVRRPDLWAEMFFRELVSNGNRLGARSVEEFLVDYDDLLTDLPALFGPIEAALGSRVTLIDHDASVAGNQHWAHFAQTAGLPPRVLALAPVEQVYASPGRDAILAAQMLTTLVADPDQLQQALRGFFAGQEPDPAAPRQSLLAPATRDRLLTTFQAKSADFAAERGYAPDYAALHAQIAVDAWQPVATIPFDQLERISHAFTQTETAPRPTADPARKTLGRVVGRDRNEMVLRLRLRPWARRIVDWLRGRR